MTRLAMLLAVLLTAACATPPAPPPQDLSPRLAQLERSSGGRPGVALLDAGGRTLLGHRAGERFAMCSTFKLPLAAMVLARGPSQPTPLAIGRADLLPHSPYSQRVLDEGAQHSVGLAAQAIVEQSDNAAANALLKLMGGPPAFTAWLRGAGDPVTRLDRYELELNENAPGDPRDTTSPAAMAGLTGRLAFGDTLTPAHRGQLRGWTAATRTGARRIRAGLPAGWTAGDKTGTCGTAWNDVAWFETPAGGRYTLAVYLDRPALRGEQAEAILAEAARIAAAAVP
jgi:beta-lactamase class A